LKILSTVGGERFACKREHSVKVLAGSKVAARFGSKTKRDERQAGIDDPPEGK
jgi:hypothetical protein